MQEIWVQSLGQADLVEKEMATHSSIPGKSQEQRSMKGHSPWGYKELDMIYQLNHHRVCMLIPNF